MDAEDGHRIKVLTYNVNWGYCRAGLATGMCHRILQAIREADADVVCLQETHDGWEVFLRQQLADRYPYMTWRHHLIPHVKTHMEEGSSAGGLAFMSIYPLEEVFHAQPEVAGSFFPGACVVVRTPAGLVDILNVHLRPPVSNSHKPSVMALFQTGLIRRAELKYFVSELCERAPALVVGDFNESRSGDAMRWLMRKGRGYRDALALRDETAVTWKWPLRMGLCLKGSYDHLMFIPERLQAVACEVMAQYELVSDHIPVCATFIVRPSSPLSVPSHAADSPDTGPDSSTDGFLKRRAKAGDSKRKHPLVRVTSDVVASEGRGASLGIQEAGAGAGAYDLVDTTGHLIPRRASFPAIVTMTGQPLLSPRARARALGGLSPRAAAPCECASCRSDAEALHPPLFVARSAQTLSSAACARDTPVPGIQTQHEVGVDATHDDDLDAVVVSVTEGHDAAAAPAQPKRNRASLFFGRPKSLT